MDQIILLGPVQPFQSKVEDYIDSDSRDQNPENSGQMYFTG